MKSPGMDVSSGTRSVRLRGLCVALMLLSTCACADCADHNITAKAGETAVLPCKCPTNQPPYLVWQKTVGERQVVVNYYREEDDKNNQIEAEYLNRTELRLTGPCSLELHSVRRSDEGLYKCYYQIEPLRHDSINLQVTGMQFTSAVTVDKGDNSDGMGAHGSIQTAVSSSVCGILVIVITAAVVYVGIACRKRHQTNGRFIATQREEFNSCQ